ncbi:MAG: DUF2141 domain-containing protein [Sphingomonas sp.]
MLAGGTLTATSPIAQLELDIEGLRSAKGAVSVCLTTDPDHYPDCQNDPAARRQKVAARALRVIRFADVPSGTYAVALIHDENGNNRLDTTLGVPREGVGFSRNPPLYFGPPRFARARFPVGNAAMAERIRVKYFL